MEGRKEGDATVCPADCFSLFLLPGLAVAPTKIKPDLSSFLQVP